VITFKSGNQDRVKVLYKRISFVKNHHITTLCSKQVIYGFFAQAHEKLLPGGRLYIVIRKQHGAPSAIKFLQTLYAEVNTLEKEAGYWILEAVKAE